MCEDQVLCAPWDQVLCAPWDQVLCAVWDPMDFSIFFSTFQTMSCHCFLRKCDGTHRTILDKNSWSFVDPGSKPRSYSARGLTASSSKYR